MPAHPTILARSRLIRQAAYSGDAREPELQVAHRLAALAFALTAPMGVVPGEITGAVLLVIAAMRWRTTLTMLRTMLELRATWLLLAMIAWTVIGCCWSPNPGPGLRRLFALRALLLVPALLPVAADRTGRRSLCMALGIGVACLALSQIVQYLRMSDLASGVAPRLGGMHGDQGKAGLWNGVGICLATGLLLEGKAHTRQRVAAMALALLAGAGLAIAGTLRAILGVMLALPTACAAGLRDGVLRGRSLAIAGVALLLVSTIAGALKGPALMERARTSWRETDANIGGTHGGNTGTRVYWLKAGIWAVGQKPLIGWGTGGTPVAIGSYPGRAEMERAAHTAFPEGAAEPGHPHSIYLMALIELGPLGLLLLLATAWATIRLLAIDTSGPASVAFLAIAGLWFVAAAFDTVYNFSTMSAIALALGLGMPMCEERQTCECF